MSRDRAELKRIELAIAFVTLLVAVAAAAAAVASCLSAKSSAEAAKKQVDVAREQLAVARTADSREAAEVPGIPDPKYYLSRSPTYDDADDRADVWFLEPPIAVPLRQPPEWVVANWREEQHRQYFVWLGVENIGESVINDLQVRPDTVILRVYDMAGVFEELPHERFYDEPIELGAPLAPGRRAMLLIGKFEDVPEQMDKTTIRRFIENNKSLKCLLEVQISYTDIVSDETHTVSSCLNPDTIEAPDSGDEPGPGT